MYNLIISISMKSLFIIVIILILSHVSFTKADDIRDFEIEEMSIGDSLLKFYNKNLIKKKLKVDEDLYNYKKSKTYQQTGFSPEDGKDFNTYEFLQIMVKRNDPNYIIHGISGKIFKDYDNDINACYDLQDIVENEIKNNLINLEVYKPDDLTIHVSDKSKKSTVRQVGLFFSNDDVISIECYYWSEKMNYANNFKISVATQELNEWWYSKN